MKPDKQIEPWPILYWGNALLNRNKDGNLRDAMGALATLFIGAFTGRVAAPEPQDCVRLGFAVSTKDKKALAHALVHGEVYQAEYGFANCRMCGVELGNKDLTGWGFMWPEKAEHYILEHGVWTPGCDRLLAAVRTT